MKAILLIIITIVLVLIFCTCGKSKEGYSVGLYSKLCNPTCDECEYSEACRWDAGRTATMSDGRPGVCTLGGLLCPSFYSPPPYYCDF